jgi:hypothetical protein
MTFSSIGGTTMINSGLMIQHSVGQQSVIGTFSNKKFVVSQGFLDGKVFKEKPANSLEVIPYPNHFTDIINFKFSLQNELETLIIIYDMSGKLVYQKEHIPQNNTIEVDLAQLSNGIYLAYLKTGASFTQPTRIIKKS